MNIDETMPDAAGVPDWQPLPERARLLFAISRTGLAIPLGVAGFVLFRVFGLPAFAGLLGGIVLAGGFGLWLGFRQFRHVAWRLDADGLAIRRGRLYQRETRVPVTRVQHLDLKRGPWQRRRNLATLIVHTAGTRHSAVTLAHLDADDAERLRDVLGRQIDRDDDD
ncbi:PH domain-containing protein [Lysobacter sp. Root494]|uniref:PH domain-containing protein n=1 Tax=Lysobacter sp. Root494 TaxID=1736549 RepID=UPI001F4378E3|nr:PH domain-containing protein [Lysobacter sp. Root494]